MKRKNGEDKLERKHIYVGETSRSLYERTKEHFGDGRARAEDSHIAKHWDEQHQGEEMPQFRFMIVKSFLDCLSRQVAESVRIDWRDDPLNSKAVYSRNRLSRLELEKTEWEKEIKESQKRLKRRKIEAEKENKRNPSVKNQIEKESEKDDSVYVE